MYKQHLRGFEGRGKYPLGKTCLKIIKERDNHVDVEAHREMLNTIYLYPKTRVCVDSISVER